VGANVDFLSYDVVKGNNETPRFDYDDLINGVSYVYATPYQLQYGTGDPTLKKSNEQMGLYMQDDWSPTPRLTLNLGVRWDFETKMMNYDYVTPQMVRDTVLRYNDQLPFPLDPARYFSDGNNRDPFYGAVQPRVGFSYALEKTGKTTVFGGYGLY